mgnify:CR=1 FL=1
MLAEQLDLALVDSGSHGDILPSNVVGVKAFCLTAWTRTGLRRTAPRSRRGTMRILESVPVGPHEVSETLRSASRWDSASRENPSRREPCERVRRRLRMRSQTNPRPVARRAFCLTALPRSMRKLACAPRKTPSGPRLRSNLVSLGGVRDWGWARAGEQIGHDQRQPLLHVGVTDARVVDTPELLDPWPQCVFRARACTSRTLAVRCSPRNVAGFRLAFIW